MTAKRNFLTYIPPRNTLFCHIEALHSTPPKSELNTDLLVTKIIKKIGCAGIIANISRTKIDLNREPITFKETQAQAELFHLIRHNLEALNIISNNRLIRRYLRLNIHGMKNRPYADIEMGTLYANLAYLDLSHWLLQKLNTFTPWKIAWDQRFNGDEVLLSGRELFGNDFETIQLEINKNLRLNHSEQLVQLLSQIILEYNQIF